MTHTVCPWKGVASYYTLARKIKSYSAFYGVVVIEKGKERV